MIRTYSLLKALYRDWEIHYVALQNSGQLQTKTYRDPLYSRNPNLTLESFDELAKIREKLWPLFWIGNKLKASDRLRPFFWTLNLPFVLHIQRRNHQIIKNRLYSKHFDAVLLDYTKMAHHLVLVQDRRVKKIINVHNAESDVARQMMLSHENGLAKAIYWLRWRFFEAYEKLFIPRCDFLLAPSKSDAEFYHALAPNIETVVIPNAVDTATLKPLPPPDEPFSLIYPGRMDYPPNVQAAHTFCHEILPRITQIIPDVRFYIVGKNPIASVQELQSDQVLVTGYVEDVLPFWQKAAVLVVPLKVGSGTRIKIIEAMALGRPAVSTSKGCEGLEVTHGKEILIADDPESFATNVIRLLQDSSLYLGLVHAARKLVEEKYSFKTVERLVDKILGDGD